MGKYNIVISKNSQKITNIEEWRLFGGPKRENQWKDGRSSKELAKYILSGEGYIPKEIEEALLKLDCDTNKTFYAEPEKVTGLICSGGGRNHDLILKQVKGDIVIGIEAKSDESLGYLISQELSKQNITENKIKRIKRLYESIYGSSDSNTTDIRYQLLTGMIGTLVEAQKSSARKALFLIITLKKEGSYKKEKIESNIKDINNFVNSLANHKIGDKYHFSSFPNIEFYIEHIEIDV